MLEKAGESIQGHDSDMTEEGATDVCVLSVVLGLREETPALDCLRQLFVTSSSLTI